MKKIRVIAISAFFVLGLGGLIFWLSSQKESANEFAKKELEIGYFSRAIGYAPYFVAQELGWFDDHPALSNLKISHTIYGDRATIADSFDSGKLDVLLSAEIPAIMCRAQGNDVRIVAVTGLITLHWLTQSNIRPDEMKSLAGKTVAYQSGTSSHYGLLTTLDNAKLDKSLYNLRNMKAVEAKTAFETGSLDAWVVWSPFFEQQIVNGKGAIVPDSKYNYTTVMTVSNSFRQENPEIVTALEEILDRAKRWIPANMEHAEKIVAKSTGQTDEVAREALKNVDFSANLSPEIVDMFQGMAQFLAENNAVRQGLIVDIRKDMISPDDIKRQQ